MSTWLFLKKIKPFSLPQLLFCQNLCISHTSCEYCFFKISCLMPFPFRFWIKSSAKWLNVYQSWMRSTLSYLTRNCHDPWSSAVFGPGNSAVRLVCSHKICVLLKLPITVIQWHSNLSSTITKQHKSHRFPAPLAKWKKKKKKKWHQIGGKTSLQSFKC